MKICVKMLQGKEHSFEVDSNQSVLSLKEKISDCFGVAANRQRLVFKGKTLNDTHTLSFYSIVDGSKLFLSVPNNETSEESTFFESIQSLLRKHFSNDDTSRILRELRKDTLTTYEIIKN
ncbi:ubiquitin-like protein 4A-B [Dinothrombium tinctorium]|uniref:Ubiquitin-like protein 4A-B n=1 Tax=Dinothrombium tinctorium TaxID=1965070 RepID=A0A443QPX9_9ACAR|nr:ubiquitin-like protein 4A-B [Dinothrombium tinctorium]